MTSGATGLSSRIFEMISQEAIVGILVFSGDDESCKYINKLAAELIQAPPGFVAASYKLTQLFPEQVRTGLRGFTADMARQEGLFQDVVLNKTNQSSFLANIGVKFIRDEDGTKWTLLMFQDITFQKKLQREILLKQDEIKKAFNDMVEQNRKLKELDHAKDKFIALTTHELRTPLSAIVATADVLTLKLYEPEQLDDLIKSIYEQGLHLMELVNDVLDFAKIRAGKMEYFVEQKGVSAILKKLMDGFHHMAEQNQVTLELAAPAEDPLCYYDLMRLKEVINNILSNSIKYNRKGGHVYMTIEDQAEFVRISIRDTGEGIAPDKIQHVFNEFETVESVSHHHKGTGLGMPISKRLAEGMGGTLTLESTVGVGTTFFVTIPKGKVLDEAFYRTRPDLGGDLAA